MKYAAWLYFVLSYSIHGQLLTAEAPAGPALQVKGLYPLGAEISWPVVLKDYVLEEANRLGPAGRWRLIEQEDQVNGETASVKIEALGTTRFYRLRHRLPALSSATPTIEYALVNLGGTHGVVGQPFQIEVRASFNTLLSAAAFRLSTSGEGSGVLSARSADPVQGNGLAYISSVSQVPFTNGLPANLDRGGILEVLLGYGPWPFDGIQAQDEAVLERLEIIPTKPGSLTLTLSAAQAVTSRWARQGSVLEQVYLDPLRSSVTVQIAAGTLPPATSAAPTGMAAGGTAAAADWAALVSVRTRLGMDAQLPENKAADINQDGRIDLLDLVAVRNGMARPEAVAPNSELVLNELAFNPTNGQPLWVEVTLRAQTGQWWGAVSIRNGAGQQLGYSSSVSLRPGWFLQIVFDGYKPMETLGPPANSPGYRWHIPSSGNFNPTNDQCLLLTADKVVDSISWGNRPESGSGLNIQQEAVPLGGSIGREGYESDRWVRFETPTPGEPNSLSVPKLRFPYPGCWIPKTNATHFAWLDPRTAPIGYDLEVALTADFGNPSMRTNVNSCAVDLIPGLEVGSYYWRVRSKGGGLASPWTAPHEFEVVDLAGPPGAQKASLHTASSPPWVSSMKIISGLVQKGVLPPRKDTLMLCLECKQETGPHAWDMPHLVGLSGSKLILCEHERNYAPVAVAASINHYYGGDITQDELAYAQQRLKFQEPEYQLAHGSKLDLGLAMATALAPMPVDKIEVQWSDDINWNHIKMLVDDGVPSAGEFRLDPFEYVGPVAIVGYAEVVSQSQTKRCVLIADGFSKGYGALPLAKVSSGSILVYPLQLPGGKVAAADPDATEDTDGDGLCDFDELNRFHLSPMEKDTDGDGLEDKIEVRSYVFGKGFVPRAPDPTGSGLRAELNPDTDGDGCKDGDEDRNHNGTLFESNFFGGTMKEADESDPFLADEFTLEISAGRSEIAFKERLEIQVALSDKAGNPIKDAMVELRCEPSAGHWEVAGFNWQTDAVLVTDKDGKASATLVAGETEATSYVEAIYQRCVNGRETKRNMPIRIVPYDWIFAIQEKAVLTGPTIKPGYQIRMDSPDVGKGWQTFAKDPGYQKVTGHFFHPQTDKPGLYINLIAVPVPRGMTAALYVDGIVAPDLTWKRSSPLQNPQNWEVQIASSYAWPYPPSLNIVNSKGSTRKTPLVWWTSCESGYTRDRRRAYNSTQDLYRVLAWDQSTRWARFFFGDGDGNGMDTAKTWPKEVHTSVGFIPQVVIDGYPAGTFVKGDEPDIFWGTWTGQKGGVYSYYDIFGFFKHSLMVVLPTPWTVQTISGDEARKTSVQTELNDLGPQPVLPFVDNITFQRDFIGAELKEMNDRGLVVPSYSIRMLTSE